MLLPLTFTEHLSVPALELELGIEDKGAGDSNLVIITFFPKIILDSQEVAKVPMYPSPGVSPSSNIISKNTV